jgi:transposase
MLPEGRPRKAAKREIVNERPCSLRAGCAWQSLQHGFPSWQMGHGFLCR